jgi:mono/diheme cytochrome c family protein
MSAPYRQVAVGPAALRGRFRYFPCVGLWPLVLAIVVAVPAAIWARQDGRLPSVVVCTTVDVPGTDKLCSVVDRGGVGRARQVACRETPAALEAILTPSSPFARSTVTATEVELPKPPGSPLDALEGCGTAPSNGIVDPTNVLGFAPRVFAQPPPVPAAAPPPPPVRSLDGGEGLAPDAARALIRQCALTPDTSGPQRTVAVTVLERDYSRSVAIVLGGLGLALLSMLRRRATVTFDPATRTMQVVERGSFRVRRSFVVPTIELERAMVTMGPSGLLNGKRVELTLRSGARVALLDGFVPLTSGVHTRLAWRLSAQLDGQHARSVSAFAVPPPRKRGRAVWLALLGLIALAGGAGGALLRLRAPAPAARPPAAHLERMGVARDGSTIVLASLEGRRLAIVADEDAQAVRAIDVPTASTPLGPPSLDVLETKLGSPPGAMVLGADGRLFVALPRESAVAVLAATGGAAPQLREVARIESAAEPVALSLTKDDATLVVVSSYGHALQSFRVATLARALDVDLPRSPSALTLSADGTRAVVAHDTGSLLSIVDLALGARTSTTLDVVVTLPRSRHERHIALPGQRSRREIYFASDEIRSPMLQDRVARVGDRFFVPGVAVTTGDTSIPATDGYYDTSSPVEAFNISELALWSVHGKPMSDRLFPTRGRPSAGAHRLGCLLPRAAVADEAGEWLYVACQGPGNVYKVDVGRRKRCRDDGAWGAPFRVADGPTGMALDDEEHALLVWSQFAQKITVLPYDGGLEVPPRWVEGRPNRARAPLRQWTRPLTPTPRDAHASLVARGRSLFFATNEPAISGGGPACASCHIGGRDDALAWPTPRGPRQTPMLAGRLAGTAPYGWSADQATLPEYIGQTFRRLGGTGLQGEDFDALVAYIEALPPPRFAAREPDAVARGQALFFSSTGCSGCHAAEAGTFTDTETHDVSSRTDADSSGAFDTPSLPYIGGTAPYFHDGRYPTLMDVLVHADGTMGHTKHLTPDQRRDLVRYLESLGATRPTAHPSG